MTEHVIWVVIRCGTQAATVASWHHTEDEATAMAARLNVRRPPDVVVYMITTVSDVPVELRAAS
jgi:hypothetical protein